MASGCSIFVVADDFQTRSISVNGAGIGDEQLEARVDSILSSMSVQQKVGQMVQAEIKYTLPSDVSKYGLGSVLNGGGSFPLGDKHASAAEWLELADAYYRASLVDSPGSAGIPILWGTDAVHGHNNLKGATLFPHNIGLGAMYDPDIVRAIGAATAREVAVTGINWVFAPTLAVVQDDRWGRTYEGYSERPELVSDYATAMVLGLQGALDGDFLSDTRVMAAAKHYIGDGGTHAGMDQGDNQSSIEELLTVHGAGYVRAIDAGVQTVMASFSSWQGEKIHGNYYLLTEVLKGQLGFDGFVIGDWNAHGQLNGCSNDSCAAAINAGIDMLMAPASWKKLIENTVAQVNSGEITEARINDAVRRILRVKIRAGLLDRGAPSERQIAGEQQWVGHPDHRILARQAVRRSLVLLKNNNGLLPLDPTQRILVAGDGADNITKQSGGWTLTWQGRSNSNEDFPGATTIYQGVKRQVDAAGGSVIFSEDGIYDESQRPDVAIVVFGEDPYAEGQGDRKSLNYQAGYNADLQLLRRLQAANIPVVSVFLSGRPMWVNAELNASNAFVAAWLPGSEGAGVADLLLRDGAGNIQHDFSGKLSFSWPGIDVNIEDNELPVRDNLFEYGFGLSYADNIQLAGDLTEIPARGLPNSNPMIFNAGIESSWAAYVGDSRKWNVPVQAGRAASKYKFLNVSAVDRRRQEDSWRLEWAGERPTTSQFFWQSEQTMDLNDLNEQDGALWVNYRVDRKPEGEVALRMDCSYPCHGSADLTQVFSEAPKGEWMEMGIALSCFEQLGADLSRINSPLVLITNRPFAITLNQVALVADPPKSQLIHCPLDLDERLSSAEE